MSPNRTGRQVAILAPAVLVFCVIVAVSSAQTPSTPAKTPDYSQEPSIFEEFLCNVTFDKEGRETEQIRARARVQSQPGVQRFGLLRFSYASSNSDLEVVYVRVLKPDGRVVVTPAENILEIPADITREAPFYSDLKEKQVAVKGLEAGDTLEYETRMRQHTPLIPGQFWFAYEVSKDEIMLREQLEVRVPRGRPTKVQSPGLTPEVTEEGEAKIFTWKSSNLERKAEDKKQARAASLPPPPSIQLTSFQDWNEIARWYRGLADERAAPTAEVRAKAEELTKSAKSEEEKARVLYAYVATKIRYIGIAFGIGRYQPHAAADVLSNGYGDCKDKHTLLAALLASVGIKAYPALANSARKIDPQLPSPGQFDHLITIVPQGDKLAWLDTTAEVAPFGYLVPNIRDEQVLTMPELARGELRTTPADPPFPSLYDFRITGTLDQAGTFTAKVNAVVRGDLELALRAAFRRVPQPQWKDVVQGVSYGWSFGGTVSDVTVSAPEATDEAFRLQYSYTRKSYGDLANKRMPLPFPPLFGAEPEESDKESSEPIPLGTPGEFRLEARMELPKDALTRLPVPTEVDRDFAGYRSSYEMQGGVLHATRSLSVRQREVPAVRREELRSLQKIVRDDETAFIGVLFAGDVSSMLGGKLPGDLGTILGTRAPEPEPDPEARAVFEEAKKALRAGDLTAAADALKRTVQADPKFERGYEMLAFLYMNQQRFPEALETWEELKKVNPENGNAASNMGSILFGMKRYAEAIPELDAAAEKYPDNPQISFQLGQAYARTGEGKKALDAFQRAWQNGDLAGTLNNVAYELAEDNLLLEDALRYALQATEMDEQAAAGITLERLGQPQMELMQHLGAKWDTVGWVHFRMGHTAEAEKYLMAAWELSQYAAVADHLGQLYEKSGNKVKAIQFYALAIGVDSREVDSRQRLGRLLGDNARVNEAVKSHLNELMAWRKSNLPVLVQGKVSAEFFVLFASDRGVEDVKFIRGAPELKNAGKAIRDAKYRVTFPGTHRTRLVRRGIVFCSAFKPACEFVLMTPDSARAPD